MKEAIQFKLGINQPLAIQFKLTLSRACVLDYLALGAAWSTEHMTIDGKTFFYLSRVKACKDLPLITSNKDTMYRHYRGLHNTGLIEHHLEPVLDSNKSILYMKDFIRINPEIAEKYYKPKYEKADFEASDKNNDTGGAGIDETGGYRDKNNDGGSDENPTNYNTNIDYSINDSTSTNVDAGADHSKKPTVLIVEYLNQQAGRAFKASGDAGRSNREKVRALLKKGYTVAELKAMIDFKCAEWKDSTYWRRYLRPDTLFGSKAATYIEEAKTLTPIKAQKNGKYKHADQPKQEALRRSESEYSESGGLFRPRRQA